MPTLAEVREKYLKKLERDQDKSDRTKQTYKEGLRRFFKVLDPSAGVTSLEVSVIDDLAESMVNLAPSTQRLTFNIAKSFLSFVITRHPRVDITPHALEQVVKDNLPSTPKKKELDFEAVESLLEKAAGWDRNITEKRNRAIVYLFAHSGIRLDELRKLERSDIDLSDRRFKIRNGKGDKPRTGYLSKIAGKFLKEYLKERDDSYPWLFIDHRGLESVTVIDALGRSTIRKIVRPYGLSPHALRHYCISRLANDPERGVYIAQQVAGHSRIATTEGYLHPRENDIADAMNGAFDE